jgi:hypothetical protein
MSHSPTDLAENRNLPPALSIISSACVMIRLGIPRPQLTRRTPRLRRADASESIVACGVFTALSMAISNGFRPLQGIAPLLGDDEFDLSRWMWDLVRVAGAVSCPTLPSGLTANGPPNFDESLMFSLLTACGDLASSFALPIGSDVFMATRMADFCIPPSHFFYR